MWIDKDVIHKRKIVIQTTKEKKLYANRHQNTFFFSEWSE